MTVVLASLRQYQLCAGLLEKALKFAYEDKYIWHQFALALVACGRRTRAALVLQHCVGKDIFRHTYHILLILPGDKDEGELAPITEIEIEEQLETGAL